MHTATAYTPADIRSMKGKQLFAAWETIFGKPTKSKNTTRLRTKLLEAVESGAAPAKAATSPARAAVQAVEGGIAQAAIAVLEAAQETVKAKAGGYKVGDNDRLPPVGTVLVREHGGAEHRVLITAGGYQYPAEQVTDGPAPKLYQSLSTIARKILGTNCYGPVFFGLPTKAARRFVPASQLSNLLRAAGLPVPQIVDQVSELPPKAAGLAITNVHTAAAFYQQLADDLTAGAKAIEKQATSGSVQ